MSRYNIRCVFYYYYEYQQRAKNRCTTQVYARDNSNRSECGAGCAAATDPLTDLALSFCLFCDYRRFIITIIVINFFLPNER